MQKVLLISSKESFFYAPLSKALVALGCRVYLGDYLGNSVLSRKTIIHKVAKRLPSPLNDFVINKAQEAVEKNILNLAREIKPNFILTSKAKEISVKTLDELRRMATTANWYPETMNNWASIQKIVSHYDYFFNYDRFVINLLKEQGHNHVHYLPFGFDLDRNKEWPAEEGRINEVTFLGSFDANLYPEREIFLDSIKDLNLKVWGNKAWLDTKLKNNYVGSLNCTAEDISNLYGSSKIVIHADLLMSRVAGTGITLRPFDVTASGALLLAHNDRKELFELFKDGEEFISFSDGPDLREKVLFYLSHPEERIRIAKAGFEKTKKHHTYLDRVRTIMNVMKLPINENQTQ